LHLVDYSHNFTAYLTKGEGKNEHRLDVSEKRVLRQWKNSGRNRKLEKIVR